MPTINSNHKVAPAAAQTTDQPAKYIKPEGYVAKGPKSGFEQWAGDVNDRLVHPVAKAAKTTSICVAIGGVAAVAFWPVTAPAIASGVAISTLVGAGPLIGAAVPVVLIGLGSLIGLANMD